MNPLYGIPLGFRSALDHSQIDLQSTDWVPHNDHKDRQNDTLIINPRWIQWLDPDDHNHLCQKLVLGCQFAPNQHPQKQDVAA